MQNNILTPTRHQLQTAVRLGTSDIGDSMDVLHELLTKIVTSGESAKLEVGERYIQFWPLKMVMCLSLALQQSEVGERFKP